MRRCIVLVLLLWSVAHVFAQEINTLSSDTPQTVTVTGEASAMLTFTLDSTATVTLTAEAAEPVDDDEVPLDPVLRLWSSEQHLLAYADDTPVLSDGTLIIERRAMIERLLLPAGEYTLRVDTFSGVQTGEVMVSLAVVDRFAATVTEADTGVLVDAILPAGAIYQREIDASAGETLIISAHDTSGTLDPLLRLHDAEGAILAENDDHASRDLSLDTLDARLIFTPDADATLTINVLDFLGRGGSVTLEICVDSPDCP